MTRGRTSKAILLSAVVKVVVERQYIRTGIGGIALNISKTLIIVDTLDA